MFAPRFEPMLASTGRPDGPLEDWVAEPKLDGWRVLVTIDTAGVTVRTRNGQDITDRLPETASLASLGCPAVLDGELVAGAGRCEDFYAITSRLSPRTRRPALTLVAFDLLWLDGHTTTALAHHERHRLLHALELPPPALAVRAYPATDADELLAACEAHGVEGLILKHHASPYRPGERSPNWRKAKTALWADHAQRRQIGKR